MTERSNQLKKLLENKNNFTIHAINASSTNKYIEYAYLNGKKLDRTYINHEEIMKGGVLEFYMTNTPSAWGSKKGQEPVTSIDDHAIVISPYIEKGDITFKENTKIILKSADTEADIYYQINDSGYKKYEAPILINEASLLMTYAKKNEIKSNVIKTQFYKVDPTLSIDLETEYAQRYNAGGNNALIDGIRGGLDYRTGAWQGYHNSDVSVIIDLGKEKTIKQIDAGFLRDQGPWIFYPTEVTYLTSTDGGVFNLAKHIKFPKVTQKDGAEINRVKADISPRKVRYIKVVAKTLGEIPEWHIGHAYNGKSWIFMDEIVIK